MKETRQIHRTRDQWRAELARAEATGETRDQVAARLGVNRCTVSLWCSRLGANLRRKPRVVPAPFAERLASMRALRASGLTLAEIGRAWGVSKARVSEILRRAAVRERGKA